MRALRAGPVHPSLGGKPSLALIKYLAALRAAKSFKTSAWRRFLPVFITAAGPIDWQPFGPMASLRRALGAFAGQRRQSMAICQPSGQGRLPPRSSINRLHASVEGLAAFGARARCAPPRMGIGLSAGLSLATLLKGLLWAEVGLHASAIGEPKTR